MSKLTVKEATEKALCKMCNRRFNCEFNEYEYPDIPKYKSGCMLRSLVVKEWMIDAMGFE